MRGLSVIIPSKNAANLVPCVKAIRDAGETCRIIVIDDFEDVNAHMYVISACGLNLRRDLWQTGLDPFVFASNINIGIQAAGTDDVILLNDDALLESPGGFTRMQKSSDGYGIVGAVTNLTGQLLQHPHGTGGIREVPHIAFVCVFIPRRTIDQVGLLDERYCLDYGVEDRDYCEAVTRAGLKIGVHDGCFVDHSKLQSAYRGAPTAARSFSKNLALFNAKWGMNL